MRDKPCAYTGLSVLMFDKSKSVTMLVCYILGSAVSYHIPKSYIKY